VRSQATYPIALDRADDRNGFGFKGTPTPS